VNSTDDTCDGPITLRSVGGSMCAMFFHAGTRIGELDLDDGTEVWPASTAERKNAPRDSSRLFGAQGPALIFAGW
jgi:hypothetical protein